jgi:hypothetical protein
MPSAAGHANSGDRFNKPQRFPENPSRKAEGDGLGTPYSQYNIRLLDRDDPERLPDIFDGSAQLD